MCMMCRVKSAVAGKIKPAPTKTAAERAREAAKRHMSAQYRKEARRKKIVGADYDVERAGDIYIEIAQAAMLRIRESKQLGRDPDDELSEKSLREEQEWRRCVDSRAFGELDSYVGCAEMIKIALVTLYDELAACGYDFGFLTDWYLGRALHGAKLDSGLRVGEFCVALNDVDFQTTLVMKVMQRMHSWWLERNSYMISQLYYLSRTWPRFVNFYLAGERTMWDYAIVLIPILKDLGVDETMFVEWADAYAAQTELVKQKCRITDSETLKGRLEYGENCVYEGVPESVQNTIRNDNGERVDAIAYNVFPRS